MDGVHSKCLSLLRHARHLDDHHRHHNLSLDCIHQVTPILNWNSPVLLGTSVRMSQSVVVRPVPLQKYSFELGSTTAGQHQWHHDSRRDILILNVGRMESTKVTNSAESGLDLTIAAGSEILVGVHCGEWPAHRTI